MPPGKAHQRGEQPNRCGKQNPPVQGQYISLHEKQQPQESADIRWTHLLCPHDVAGIEVHQNKSGQPGQLCPG